MLADLRRHLRFLLSFALGLAVGLGAWRMQAVDRLLLFSVSFCLGYLLLTAALVRGMTADMMRGRADLDDEGISVIVPIAIGSVAISLVAILLTIRDPHSGFWLRPVMALVSVPLGWAMIHTVMAFHYASLWYARRPDGRETRNLGFPGLGAEEDAQIWDFLYYSFTLGMAAQTADVTVLDTRARRLTLLHSAFSFYYNTVLLALALNAGMALG
ncbi:DUF1345 domain-containing protein [Paracoccus binzhouensis]|uniref:DUF1345 domain-containing protein n=1 Tax=Paracoccus binzhouensis TaxID=2796149 RepID=UPI0018EF3247|nr:DUF1345 domain-containing protein [Paracoccus binzhouensis]